MLLFMRLFHVACLHIASISAMLIFLRDFIRSDEPAEHLRKAKSTLCNFLIQKFSESKSFIFILQSIHKLFHSYLERTRKNSVRVGMGNLSGNFSWQNIFKVILPRAACFPGDSVNSIWRVSFHLLPCSNPSLKVSVTWQQKLVVIARF